MTSLEGEAPAEPESRKLLIQKDSAGASPYLGPLSQLLPLRIRPPANVSGILSHS